MILKNMLREEIKVSAPHQQRSPNLTLSPNFIFLWRWQEGIRVVITGAVTTTWFNISAISLVKNIYPKHCFEILLWLCSFNRREKEDYKVRLPTRYCDWKFHHRTTYKAKLPPPLAIVIIPCLLIVRGQLRPRQLTKTHQWYCMKRWVTSE